MSKKTHVMDLLKLSAKGTCSSLVEAKPRRCGMTTSVERKRQKN